MDGLPIHFLSLTLEESVIATPVNIFDGRIQMKDLTMNGHMRCCCVVITFVLYFMSGIQVLHGNNERLDGRFSFSLTTFSPSGKLTQVERALEAAALGTPIVAICRRGGTILMASPQALPSPLICDDGTARFARITPQIVVAHSGLSADGRVVVAAAQKLAVEHAHTFDESIPIELFLEEVACFFQEYTMKPASRPFGVTLLVGYIPSNAIDYENNIAAQLYRIHPSGAVEALGSYGVIGSSSLVADLLAPLKTLALHSTSSVEEDRSALVNLLKSTLAKKRNSETNSNFKILTARVSQTESLIVERT